MHIRNVSTKLGQGLRKHNAAFLCEQAVGLRDFWLTSSWYLRVSSISLSDMMVTSLGAVRVGKNCSMNCRRQNKARGEEHRIAATASIIQLFQIYTRHPGTSYLDTVWDGLLGRGCIFFFVLFISSGRWVEINNKPTFRISGYDEIAQLEDGEIRLRMRTTISSNVLRRPYIYQRAIHNLIGGLLRCGNVEPILSLGSCTLSDLSKTSNKK